MKHFKSNFIKSLLKCWKEIAISDKALIIIMIILLIQCVYNLFTPEPISTNEISISVIVRTTVAAIFGYFLSENFLNHSVIKSSDPENSIIVPLNIDDNNKEISCENNKTQKANKANENSNTLKDYICNKTFQVLVALTVCIIALISLIIGSNFHLIPDATNPSVVQFRDLISSCVGFLLGHSSNAKNSNSNK